MLLVNAKAGPSKIHGLGLIAQEFIPKGTRIWVFQPGFDLVISEEYLQQLSETSQSQVRHYAFYDSQIRSYILSSDDDRFTNHSDDPNTQNDGNYTYAVRDIAPGEEITWDYRPRGGADFTQGLAGKT